LREDACSTSVAAKRGAQSRNRDAKSTIFMAPLGQNPPKPAPACNHENKQVIV
jgi:hypothetical protein